MISKVKIFAAVSAAVLLTLGSFSSATYAQEEDMPPAGTGNISKDAKEAWKNTKQEASEAYEDLKSVFTDEGNNTQSKPVNIYPSRTAAGIIGQPVYNHLGERVATVEDIIVDSKGSASLVVVADGEFPGITMKLAAFNYGSIAQQKPDGDVIMPITEETIDQVAAFSYDPKESADNVRVIPNNGYSLAKLMDADLVDEKMEKLAAVDNISLMNGKADQIIVSFDKIFGLGGQKAAVRYGDVRMVRKDGDLDFQLSASHAAQFENYKKSVENPG